MPTCHENVGDMTFDMLFYKLQTPNVGDMSCQQIRHFGDVSAKTRHVTKIQALSTQHDADISN
jgi:hypothetical protein